jgi:hypothetical protein
MEARRGSVVFVLAELAIKEREHCSSRKGFTLLPIHLCSTTRGRIEEEPCRDLDATDLVLFDFLQTSPRHEPRGLLNPLGLGLPPAHQRPHSRIILSNIL